MRTNTQIELVAFRAPAAIEMVRDGGFRWTVPSIRFMEATILTQLREVKEVAFPSHYDLKHNTIYQQYEGPIQSSESFRTLRGLWGEASKERTAQCRDEKWY